MGAGEEFLSKDLRSMAGPEVGFGLGLVAIPATCPVGKAITSCEEEL